MTRLRGSRLAWAASFGLLLLLIGAAPVARASSPPPLYLSISGGISNSGNQNYAQSGGEVLSATIGSESVTPTSWTWTVLARVSGSTVSGESSFYLRGTDSSHDSVVVTGTVSISGMVPAEYFPDFPVECGTSIPPCSSVVPGFFSGSSNIYTSIGPTTTFSRTTMDLESAFLNPFGGPIVLASLGGSIVIVATYTHATIDWTGVQNVGLVSNTPGESPISGSFSMLTNAHEDLFAGTESETGTLTLLGMSPSSLDSTGPFTGSSVIPKSPTIDCSDETTRIPGTCTETGFSSWGSFTLVGDAITYPGSYKIQWTVPALAFEGTATITSFSGGVPSSVPEFNVAGAFLAALMLPLLLVARRRFAAGARPG